VIETAGQVLLEREESSELWKALKVGVKKRISGSAWPLFEPQ
jgi:hypothetical protein